MITFIVKPAVNPVEDLYGYRDKEKIYRNEKHDERRFKELRLSWKLAFIL